MKQEPFVIENPLVIMFKQDDKVTCHIHPSKDMTYEMYGMAVCDLVRHVAKAFKVPENDVWKWVDIERKTNTTEIIQAS